MDYAAEHDFRRVWRIEREGGGSCVWKGSETQNMEGRSTLSAVSARACPMLIHGARDIKTKTLVSRCLSVEQY